MGFLEWCDPIEMGQNFLKQVQILVKLRGQTNTFLVTVGSEEIKHPIDENYGRVDTFVYVYEFT